MKNLMHLKTKLAQALSMGLATLACASALAIEAPLMQDTFVLAPGVNYGGWGSVNVNGSGGRGLLSFDMGATLPAGTKPDAVQKASLIIFVEWLDAAGSVEVVRLLAPFNEHTATAQTMPAHTGAGSGRVVPLVGSVRPLVVDVTDMVKANLTAQNPLIGFALLPALATPNVAIQFGSKEGKRSAQLDITLASAPAAAPPLSTYWAPSQGKSCSEVCYNPRAAIAIADANGKVCKDASGRLGTFVQFFPTSQFSSSGTWSCDSSGTLAQCHCALP